MPNDSPDKGKIPSSILMHYLKSPMFRTIHADGLFGGITPRKNIHMSFWNERSPIPQIIEHKVKPDGTLGEEIIEARIGKNGIVREIDVDVIFDLTTAISIREWLDEKIRMLQSIPGDGPSQ